MDELEKTIQGLKCCSAGADREPTWNHLIARDCGKCPYNKPGIACTRALAYDALELLKAQEPRVMKLEEAKNIKTFERVWLEIRFMENIHHVQIYQFDGYPAFEQISSLPIRANWDDYGKNWILWTNEPKDEQRKAVKWDG